MPAFADDSPEHVTPGCCRRQWWGQASRLSCEPATPGPHIDASTTEDVNKNCRGEFAGIVHVEPEINVQELFNGAAARPLRNGSDSVGALPHAE